MIMDSQDLRVLVVCRGLRDSMVNRARGVVLESTEPEVNQERLELKVTEGLMGYRVCLETRVTGEIRGRRGQSVLQEALEKKVQMVSRGPEVSQESLV